MKERIQTGLVSSGPCCDRLGLSLLCRLAEGGSRITHRNQAASGQGGSSSSLSETSLPAPPECRHRRLKISEGWCRASKMWSGR